MAILGAALLAMTACTSSDRQRTVNGKTVVTIMTWESTTTNAAIDRALRDFHDPDVVIRRLDTPGGVYGDRLASLTQAKKLPDLFWCGNDTEQQYSQAGLLTDWRSRLDADTTFADSFDPKILPNWRTSDGYGGLPSLINTFGVWYNADAFQRANLPLPKAGWTWDDMYRAAGRLAHRDGATYGLVADNLTSTDGPFTMSTYSLSAGGAPFTDSVFDPQRVGVDTAYLQGVDKLAGAIRGGAVAPPGYDTANTASSFSSGKLAMFTGGQFWASTFLTNKPKIRYGFAPMPQVKRASTLSDAIGVCTPRYVPDAGATWKVLRFLNTSVWSHVLGASPVAPPAYRPAQASYYRALTVAGQTTITDTVRHNLAITRTSGVRFTGPWSSNVRTLITAYWVPAITSNDPDSQVRSMVKRIRRVISSYR